LAWHVWPWLFSAAAAAAEEGGETWIISDDGMLNASPRPASASHLKPLQTMSSAEVTVRWLLSLQRFATQNSLV